MISLTTLPHRKKPPDFARSSAVRHVWYVSASVSG